MPRTASYSFLFSSALLFPLAPVSTGTESTTSLESSLICLADSGKVRIFFLRFSLQRPASVDRSYWISSFLSTSSSCSFFYIGLAIMYELGKTMDILFKMMRLQRAFMYILGPFSMHIIRLWANLFPKFSTIFSEKSSKLIQTSLLKCR